MKHIKKRMGALLLVFCMLFSMIPNAFATSTRLELAIDSSTFTVNGVSQQIDAQGSKATIVGDYTMLPITGVVTALGGTTAWNATTRQVTIKLGTQSLVMTIDSATAYLDGVAKAMDKAPYITNDRTLVHIRSLEFFTGVTCTWDATLRKVIVTYTPSDTSQLITLQLTNDTGASISQLNMTTASGSGDTGNLLNTTLADGSTVNLQVPLTDGITSYNLYAISGSNTAYSMYTGLNVYGVKSYVSVILSENSKMNYAVDSTAVVQTSEMTFLNKSGVTIEELYFGTSSSANTLDNGDNLLSKDVDDDDEITFDIDLSDYSSWYFLAVDEDGEDYVGKVTFDDNEADEIYLKLKKAADSAFEEYDPDAAGSLTVAIVNDTGYDIEGMFLLDEGEAKDWDDYIDDADDDNEGDDFGELEDYYSDDYYLDGTDLDDTEYTVIEGIFDTAVYDLVIYFGDDTDEYVYIEDIDFEDANEAAVIYLMDDDTYENEMDSTCYEIFTDDDDEMLFLLENKTGEDLTAITIDDDTDVDVLDDFWSSTTLDDDDYMYYYMDDTSDFDNDLNFLFAYSGDSTYGDVDIDDFEDYIPFVKLTITEDDDEAIIDDDDIEDIFDLA